MIEHNTAPQTVLDYLESDGSKYGTSLVITAFMSEESRRIFAMFLIGEDAGHAADKLAESDYWYNSVKQHSHFPMAEGATHFQAIENLKKKLSEIPYSMMWHAWISQATGDFAFWDVGMYPTADFTLYGYPDTAIR